MFLVRTLELSFVLCLIGWSLCPFVSAAHESLFGARSLQIVLCMVCCLKKKIRCAQWLESYRSCLAWLVGQVHFFNSVSCVSRDVLLYVHTNCIRFCDSIPMHYKVAMFTCNTRSSFIARTCDLEMMNFLRIIEKRKIINFKKKHHQLHAAM